MSRTLSHNKKAQLGAVNRGSINIGKYSSVTGPNNDIRCGNSYSRTNAGGLLPKAEAVQTHQSQSSISSTLRSSLHQDRDRFKSPQPLAIQDDSNEAGYLKQVSEQNEHLANAVELVDTTPPTRRHAASIHEAHTSRGNQPCRVETTLLGNTKINVNSTSTLIT